MKPATTAQAAPLAAAAAPAEAWWRVGMVWLVVGGPALVVVAAIATAVIAYRGADKVLTLPSQLHANEQPAHKARNHAAAPEGQP
jgi:heme/copper-type cytochrome/quinol oxidase subunit 2